MNIGQIIRIIEIIVMHFAGAVILTQSFQKRIIGKRYEYLFWGIIGLWTAVIIRNSLLFKFSDVEFVLSFFFYTIFILVFYRIPILVHLTQGTLYWMTMLLLNTMLFLAECEFFNAVPHEEVTVFGRWYIVRLAGQAAISLLLLVYIKRQKNTSFIQFQYKWNYAGILIVLVCEWISIKVCTGSLVFWNNYKTTVEILCLVFISITVLIIFLSVNVGVKQKQRDGELKRQYEMLYGQYQTIQEYYKKNRYQIHDFKNQNILLAHYIQSGHYKEALEQLGKSNEELDRYSVNHYTGIGSIDFLLDYKLSPVKADGTEVKIYSEIYICPVQETEMSIILGNLLDNAIEAVKTVEKEKQEIELRFTTKKNNFIFSVRNPYRGKRKKADGKYLTTKTKKENHGLGISGVRQIVESYHGDLIIEDDGENFQVVMIIYHG